MVSYLYVTAFVLFRSWFSIVHSFDGNVNTLKLNYAQYK